jgi:glycosyltransferase involved in cell wall biosynthesis
MRIDRIIQVVDTLNPGGAERVAVDLANGLSSAGYSVFFCVTRQTGPLRSELHEKVEFFDLRRRKSFHGILRFRKYVVENEIGLVHAHGNSTALFCILALWGLKSVRIVHHDHNSLLDRRNIFIQKMLLKRVNAWITVSNEILQWVVNEVGYAKAVLIINPIQVSRFHKSPRKEVSRKEIIILANYRKPKDYENLIRAVNLLKHKDLGFTVQCYGGQSDHAYFRRIQSLVEELNLHDWIHLNPPVLNVPGLLSQSDIGLLSSSREGLPISLLEYMASSLPVVVTDVGENKRIVSEADCGIVVPPLNPSELAQAIEDAILGQERWTRWGLNGRKFVERNHSLEVFTKKIINDVYRKL